MSNITVRPHLQQLFERLDPAKPARVVFAIDATASRQETWELASRNTSQMLGAVGGLEIQLVHFRGERGFTASPWLTNAASLAATMSCVRCDAGPTQIGRVLAHARKENRRQKLAALILISDACEEDPGFLYASARELGAVPVFMFQENTDARVADVYRRIAEITGGATSQFDSGAAARLRDLLHAVAAFAVGGREALRNEKSEAAQLLLTQLK